MNTTASTSQEEEEQQEEEEERARCEWDFTLSTLISPHNEQVSDVLGSVELDPTDRLLATGGLSRKIRIYTLTSRTQQQHTPCDFFICTPAKLSSLRWRPDSAGRTIASADYDGVITEYDLDCRTSVSERDEHGGRRIWSLDYSPTGHLAASGSDDGTVHVWDPRHPAATITVVTSRVPFCSVEFEKEDGVYVGLGCADKCAYLYDLRNMSGPVSVFSGHRKTVTYVRFARGGRLVTSSVDGCHRLWDAAQGKEVRAYRGHSNVRSFVGMGVCKGGGLIGSGSESNEVFVYDLRWGEPIWVQEFGGRDEGGFVSAVCWREVSEDECALVAGGSNGVVKIFAGRRKEEFII